MIAIVDYGMGNLRSVEKAFHHVGAEVSVVSDAARVMAARGVVLPGVGAFGDCMANLARLGLVEAVREVVRQGRPFLGICLGMQALFESSEEAPGVAGLGLLAGSVPRFRAAGLKVPHMGWNQ
ncbi:MAG: imidazole glycerol phosphate synthase subunit HisH, partial [Verrucomicrobiae bacterium]|nr:imidazole glycerol phosphate synthase subunit HisH [Verrucomicrobiae bacterium]